MKTMIKLAPVIGVVALLAAFCAQQNGVSRS